MRRGYGPRPPPPYPPGSFHHPMGPPHHVRVVHHVRVYHHGPPPHGYPPHGVAHYGRPPF